MTERQYRLYMEHIARIESKEWISDFERDILANYKRICREYEEENGNTKSWCGDRV